MNREGKERILHQLEAIKPKLERDSHLYEEFLSDMECLDDCYYVSVREKLEEYALRLFKENERGSVRAK